MKTLSDELLYPSPGPLARATLSLRDRDFPEYIFQFGQYRSLRRAICYLEFNWRRNPAAQRIPRYCRPSSVFPSGEMRSAVQTGSHTI